MNLTDDQAMVLEGRFQGINRRDIALTTHLTLAQVDDIIDELIDMGALQ